MFLLLERTLENNHQAMVKKFYKSALRTRGDNQASPVPH